MKYTDILFDLDGTLTDPFEGITRSVQISLSYFGIEVNNRDELKCFIGPPLWESYMKYYGLSKDESEIAVAKYREYFSVKGLFENEVYNGIYEFLSEIKEQGVRLSVATSKPTVFSQKILDKFELSRFFTFLSGSELNGERINKADVIEYALENLNIIDRSKVLMVGDRHHDINGAKSSKVSSCGVLWGYGTGDELKNAGADYIVRDLDELKRIILQ